MKDKDRTCLLIDMSIPSKRNISLKTVEKLSKYKDLEIEIEKAWGMKKQQYCYCSSVHWSSLGLSRREQKTTSAMQNVLWTKGASPAVNIICNQVKL